MAEGTPLQRVFNNNRKVTDFNPGFGSPTRFAFFGSPPVPVLYAAETEEAAVCETILHETPPGPGYILRDAITARVSAPLAPTRELQLAEFMGDGLRILGTTADQLTATNSSQYVRTVLWAEAAHRAGFDGLAWMSNRRNTDKAFIFFGDRVAGSDLAPLLGSGRIYAAGDGFTWLSNYLSVLGIEILSPDA